MMSNIRCGLQTRSRRDGRRTSVRTSSAVSSWLTCGGWESVVGGRSTKAEVGKHGGWLDGSKMHKRRRSVECVDEGKESGRCYEVKSGRMESGVGKVRQGMRGRVAGGKKAEVQSRGKKPREVVPAT